MNTSSSMGSSDSCAWLSCKPSLSAERLVRSPKASKSWKTCRYSAPEIGSLIEASDALTIVGARAESQPIDFGGERGTRTLDLGIMSATL
jgi:hypothetical protein